MPCSMSVAHNQILALLRAALPVELAVKYPDTGAPTNPFPPLTASWARVSIADTDPPRPPPLVGEPQNRRYSMNGILVVELYTLAGDGRQASQTLGETVLGAFRGQKTAGGAWFRRERVNPVGADGAWWHENAVIEFQYDTLGS
jgi:hypothetical protein